jgi:hypothetical protein
MDLRLRSGNAMARQISPTVRGPLPPFYAGASAGPWVTFVAFTNRRYARHDPTRVRIDSRANLRSEPRAELRSIFTYCPPQSRQSILPFRAHP